MVIWGALNAAALADRLFTDNELVDERFVNPAFFQNLKSFSGLTQLTEDVHFSTVRQGGASSFHRWRKWRFRYGREAGQSSGCRATDSVKKGPPLPENGEPAGAALFA